MKTQNLVALGLLLLSLTGCNPIPLDAGNITLRPKEQVIYNVAEIEVVNDTRIEEIHTAPFQRKKAQHTIDEKYQRQFHDILIRFLNDLIIPDQGSSGKAVIRIDRAICIRESPNLASVPIWALLTICEKRTWISIISGDVEIENEQGHIIKRVKFNVESHIQRKLEFDGNESVKFLNELIQHTMPRLEKEMYDLKEKI